MCVCATARRRRKQAVNGYRHIAPMRRPRFKLRSASMAAKRLAAIVARERERQQRKGVKK